MFDYEMTTSPQIQYMGKTYFVSVFECVNIYFLVSLKQAKIMMIFSYKRKFAPVDIDYLLCKKLQLFFE